MISKKNSESVLIVAAEDSSTLYAQRLLEYWQMHGISVEAFGVGNQAMVDLGFAALGRSEKMAVMGLVEVLSRIHEIKPVMDSILLEVKKRRPKLALLLDYPGFNLRLAKKLKELNVPVVYYISPQIWAWRQGRVKKIKKYVDRVLTIFPFEDRFYKDHDVPVTFVGHPLLDEIDLRDSCPEKIEERRRRYGLKSGEKLLGLMPGSRRSELGFHLPTQLEVAEKLVKTRPGLRVALLVAPGMNIENIKKQISVCSVPLILVKDKPFDMIEMLDLVLCASGTATMMVGLMKKPMVIMYKMNPITAFFAKRLVKHSEFFGMVNLILGREAVPERFQEQASVEELASLLDRYLGSEELYQKTVDDLSMVQEKLGQSGATDRVAEALREFF